MLSLRDDKRSDFQLLRSHQHCDNEACSYYGQTGQSNIQIKTRRKGQLRCNNCGKLFSARKGTMHFGLRTPMDKIIDNLSLLANGMGMNAVSRQTGVGNESLHSYILLASKHVEELSA
jgi:transposase-like protein